MARNRFAIEDTPKPIPKDNQVLVQVYATAITPTEFDWYHIAVIVLTALPNKFLLELAIKNGAQAALHKTMACGDILDTAILKAIATVKRKGSTRSLLNAPQERNVAATPSNPFMDL